jgi:CheY-like chemotaxis protein
LGSPLTSGIAACRLPAYGVHDGAKVLVCSDELAEMLGASSAAEIVGRDVVTLIAPEARDQAIAAIVARTPVVCSSVGMTIDGATFPIQIGSTPVRSRSGEATLMTVRDLSPIAIVVDDEPTVARMAAFLMRNAGYQVATYTSSRRAVEEYESGTASVIVSDVLMSELDGVSMVQQLRRTDPELPVVFVSGYTTEPVPQDRNTRFVKKPFGIAELAAALLQLPERARAPLE